jgi:8-amino-7-oxononanoate synthase
MTQSIEKKLLKRRDFGNFRQLEVAESLIDFSSNDYLGLARSSKLEALHFIEIMKRQGELNGLGSTGSRLLTGNGNYAQNLESRIAAFHGRQAGVLFSCGYLANVGLISAIASRKSVFIFDSGVHASSRDGIRLGRSLAYPFRHNDLDHLESRLKKCSNHDRFILIQSIYSTDGSRAPLKEVCQLAASYGAHVIVDEAHAIGVVGPEGRGLVAEFGLTDTIFAQVATFGKGLGTFGAIVLCNANVKQAIVNYATSFIYTTALPFQSLAAIKCSYDLFPSMDQERLHIQKLIKIFRDNFPISSPTHIQEVPVEGNAAVKRAAKSLSLLGFDVRPLMSPTVRRGRELLRICLHAFNTEKEVEGLIDIIKALRGSHA